MLGFVCAIHVLLGVCAGALLYARWEICVWGRPWQPPLWLVIAGWVYATGLGPMLILLLTSALLRTSASESIFLGVCLTAPLYLSFSVPWLYSGGSFTWEFLAGPLSGVVLGPAATMLLSFARRIHKTERKL